MTQKHCPRCGQPFACLHDDDIRLCQCAGIRLSAGARAYISSSYSDCLCRNCLMNIEKHFQQNTLI
ncbi:MAG: cysteine-rich CWC family protein [Paludibacteraceae bacterium]|nr:cysteine-rich CWC family protein [Paludibacteraceae bacterium]